MSQRAPPLPPRVLEWLRVVEELNWNKNARGAQEPKKKRLPSHRRRCEKNERKRKRERKENNPEERRK
jgi:hypothetical protein